MKKRALFIQTISLPALLFASSGTSVFSQEVVIRPRQPLQHEVAVVLKLVQVYATDKKGKAVDDLRLEDFVLTVDGRPVAITAFEKRQLSASPALKAQVDADDEAERRAAIAGAAPRPDPMSFSSTPRRRRRGRYPSPQPR